MVSRSALQAEGLGFDPRQRHEPHKLIYLAISFYGMNFDEVRTLIRKMVGLIKNLVWSNCCGKKISCVTPHTSLHLSCPNLTVKLITHVTGPAVPQSKQRGQLGKNFGYAILGLIVVSGLSSRWQHDASLHAN